MVKRGSPCIKMTGKAKFPVAEGETCIVLNGDAVSTSFMYKRLKKSKSIENSGITTKRRDLPDSIGLLCVLFQLQCNNTADCSLGRPVLKRLCKI